MLIQSAVEWTMGLPKVSHLDLFNYHVSHINIASIGYPVRRRLGDIMYSVNKNTLAPSPTNHVFSMEYIHTAHLVRLRPSMF